MTDQLVTPETDVIVGTSALRRAENGDVSDNLTFKDAAHMYQITLACLSVPAHLGEAGAADVQQEFAKRPWHENVRCVWDGKELLLHAESDWDTDGKALVDEFSDAISACMAAFDGEIEVRSISLAPEDA